MSTKTTDTNTPSGPYMVEKSSGVYVIMGPGGRWPFHFSDERTAKLRAHDLNTAYHSGQKSMVKGEVGLNEEDVMAVYLAHENYFNIHEGTPAKRSGNFRARIKNALKLKADIASAPPTDNTEKK